MHPQTRCNVAPVTFRDDPERLCDPWPSDTRKNGAPDVLVSMKDGLAATTHALIRTGRADDRWHVPSQVDQIKVLANDAAAPVRAERQLPDQRCAQHGTATVNS